VSVRALQARVRRLEQSRASASPILAAFGTFAAFEEHCDAQVAAGELDPRDFPVVVLCLRRWEEQGVWDAWAKRRTWERGA
jgi:hypothetical protein